MFQYGSPSGSVRAGTPAHPGPAFGGVGVCAGVSPARLDAAGGGGGGRPRFPAGAASAANVRAGCPRSRAPPLAGLACARYGGCACRKRVGEGARGSGERGARMERAVSGIDDPVCGGAEACAAAGEGDANLAVVDPEAALGAMAGQGEVLQLPPIYGVRRGGRRERAAAGRDGEAQEHGDRAVAGAGGGGGRARHQRNTAFGGAGVRRRGSRSGLKPLARGPCARGGAEWVRLRHQRGAGCKRAGGGRAVPGSAPRLAGGIAALGNVRAGRPRTQEARCGLPAASRRAGRCGRGRPRTQAPPSAG